MIDLMIKTNWHRSKMLTWCHPKAGKSGQQVLDCADISISELEFSFNPHSHASIFRPESSPPFTSFLSFARA
jgi:hypothetical protein